MKKLVGGTKRGLCLKGQASFEFMLMVILVAITALASFVAVYGKVTSSDLAGRQKELAAVCDELVQKIDSAFFYGSGFSQNITLPDKINGRNYTVSIKKSYIVCESENFDYPKKFFASNVTNISGAADFSVPLRKIKIENSEGVVVIL